MRRSSALALLAAACFTDPPPADDEGTGGMSESSSSAADTTTLGDTSGSDSASVDTTIAGTSDASTTSADTSGDTSTTDTTGTTVCVHRVFTTTDEFTSIEVSSFMNASLLCAMEADDAGLDGDWAAVLSDSEGPAGTHLEICGDVVLANDGDDVLTDTLVATEEDWWSFQHVHGIDRHADGTVVPDETQFAWTGTNPNGTSDGFDCEGWDSSDPSVSGSVGYTNDIHLGAWSNESPVACNQLHRLYCIEQFR
jgi:hypothetical protein